MYFCLIFILKNHNKLIDNNIVLSHTHTVAIIAVKHVYNMAVQGAIDRSVILIPVLVLATGFGPSRWLGHDDLVYSQHSSGGSRGELDSPVLSEVEIHYTRLDCVQYTGAVSL